MDGLEDKLVTLGKAHGKGSGYSAKSGESSGFLCHAGIVQNPKRSVIRRVSQELEWEEARCSGNQDGSHYYKTQIKPPGQPFALRWGELFHPIRDLLVHIFSCIANNGPKSMGALFIDLLLGFSFFLSQTDKRAA
jgi:hypothetical protein